jgi:ferredoxin
MAINLDVKVCICCGCCSDVCTQGALGLEEKAVVYESRCVECGECIELCPVGALSL